MTELPGVHRVHFPYESGDDIPGDGHSSEGYVMLSADSPQDAAGTVAAVGSLLRAEISRSPDRA
ncbi:hypothetical protein MB828_17635 [Streptomyces arenae]|nr:hypothetical protein [Streptomyces arenae]